MAEHADLRGAQHRGHVEGMGQRIVGRAGRRIEGEVDLAAGRRLAGRGPFQHRRDEGRHGDAGGLQLAGDGVHLVEGHAEQVAGRRPCACRGGGRRSRCRTTASRAARVRFHRRSRRGRGGGGAWPEHTLSFLVSSLWRRKAPCDCLSAYGLHIWRHGRRHIDLRGRGRHRPVPAAQVRQPPRPDRRRDRHRQDGHAADPGRGLRGLWRAGLHGRREGRPLGRQPGRRHQSRAPSSAPGSSRSTATRAAPSRRSTGTCSAPRAIRCARR